MAAVNRDLYIEAGATFTLGFNWYTESKSSPGQIGDPYDLTGAVARMQVVKDGMVLIDAKTSNGMITLGTTDGRIDIAIPDETTRALIDRSAKYDLLVGFTNGDVRRVIQGNVTISPPVTDVP